jgi:hypothetical protein
MPGDSLQVNINSGGLQKNTFDAIVIGSGISGGWAATDGACMTSTANQSPSILYMALTARATNYAIDEMKKGNL